MENCRPVFSGIFNLLPALKGDPVTFKTIITFDQDVDENALATALNRTVEIFPLIGKKIEERDGVYYYVDNNLPFVISKGMKEIKPSLAEGNFHSMTFTYEKNKLCILVNHVFFDGAGFRTVFETLFYFYFCIVDGKNYEVPAGVHTKFSEGIIAEPFAKKFETDDAPIFDNDSDVEIFKFPELDTTQDLLKATEFITVSVDSKEFMHYVKSVGGTPMTSVINLFFTVFQKSHPENDKTLKNLTSARLSEVLENPDTILNAAYLLSYFSTPEDALKVDIEAERSKNLEMRAILKRYREINNLKKVANYLYDLNEKFQIALKNPSSGKMSASPNVKLSSYIVYIGTFHFGEYAYHVKNLQVFSKINSVYSVVFLEAGNKFFINLRQPFHSDLYKNIFLDELQQRGLKSARMEVF